MQFGVVIPSYGRWANPQMILDAIRTVEGEGFDAAWFGDHIVIPDYAAHMSPPPWLHAVSCMLVGAGCTERIRLGSDVLVLPYRNPVELSQLIASGDQLSSGRLILGVGVGYIRGEFDAVGAPPYDERGAVTDEFLRAMRTLWESARTRFVLGEMDRLSRRACGPPSVAAAVPGLGWWQRPRRLAPGRHSGQRLASPLSHTRGICEGSGGHPGEAPAISGRGGFLLFLQLRRHVRRDGQRAVAVRRGRQSRASLRTARLQLCATISTGCVGAHVLRRHAEPSPAGHRGSCRRGCRAPDAEVLAQRSGLRRGRVPGSAGALRQARAAPYVSGADRLVAGPTKAAQLYTRVPSSRSALGRISLSCSCSSRWVHGS